ncbi:MAG: hypothetical protein ACN4EP_09280 [Sediminibacterium sp.]
MEQLQQIKRKKKDRKPIYILLAFLLLFIVFIYFITKPSLQSKVINQIQACSNVNDVKSLFERYKFELLESDNNGNKIVAIEFQDAVRNKLNSFNLNDKELEECLAWLPPSKASMNIIVIPDLSRRIIDSINNPNQIENDLFVLNTIWHSFKDFSKLRQDTKDYLMVDVTDIDQAKGQFNKVADKLRFDLSLHKGKSNRLYFTEDKTKQFESAVVEMYNSAKQKPLGADYLFYFKRYLVNRIKKSTLFESYVNKIIIITDGYLEAGHRTDTKLTPSLYKSVAIGNIKDVITISGLGIPKVSIDLSDTDVLVCEVNERRTGKTKDFEILKAYWEDWLTRLGASKVSFIQREQANGITKTQIEAFLRN